MWIEVSSNECYFILTLTNLNCTWLKGENLPLSGRVFNGSGKPIDRGPSVLAEDYLDIMGMTSVMPLSLFVFSAKCIGATLRKCLWIQNKKRHN